MSLLDQSIGYFQRLLESSSPTWADIRRQGIPATVTLRKSYQGYVLRGHFYYLDKDEDVKVVSISSDKIRKALDFGTHQTAVTESLNVIPLVGKALAAYMGGRGTLALKAAAALYAELSQRGDKHKDPLQVACEVYDLPRKKLENYLTKNNIRESIINASGNSIVREIGKLSSVVSVDDVRRITAGYSVIVTDTDHNQFEIIVKPKPVINKNV